MENNIYEKKSVNSLILTFSLPAIISLIIEILTSVTDTMFAGHLLYHSEYALTTMGLIAPLLGIYTAFQSLFAVSTSNLIARYLNNRNIRDRYFSTGIISSFLFSIVISIFSFIFMDMILNTLDAKGIVFQYAKSYLLIQLASNIFSSIGYTFTSCIRAFGYPKIETLFTAIAVIINIIFNYLFAFVLDLGFIGLAYGTLVSEIFCVGLSIIWLFRKKLFPKQYKFFSRKTIKEVSELFCLGIAQAIIQILSGCTGFFVNNSLLINTTVSHVASWSIIQNIYTLMLMPIVGITQGIQTIISYYNGHNKENEKKQIIKKTLLYTVIYGILVIGIVSLIGDKIISIFGATEKIYMISKVAMKIVFLTFPIVGIFYTIITLLEVTGYEVKAVILGVTRQIILMIPLVYILPVILPNYMNAPFLAVPIADMLVTGIAFLFFKHTDEASPEILQDSE